ncbi:MAG: hypothetical protein JO179_22750 [Solirubrobacterales bacterium]|nr:hypothetical protein [Solirubrobacterales bacterium]
MNDDWRAYRPAIWLALLGVAVIIVVSPHYLGAFLLGLAIGAAIRIRQRRARQDRARARQGQGRAGPRR